MTAASSAGLQWPKNFHAHFVIINVSGFRYLMKKRDIAKFPKTRLAQIVANEQSAGRELYCDRNPYIFPYICDFYRHGIIHIPSETYCWTIVREELLFWGISLDHMPDCCTVPLSDDLRALDKRKKLQRLFGDIRVSARSMDQIVMEKSASFQRGYNFLYQPWRSISGRTYEMLYTFLTLFYAFLFVFECVFWARDTTKAEEFLRSCYDNDSSLSPFNTPWNETYQRALKEHNWVRMYQLTRPAQVFYYIEGVCLVVFAFDLFMRLMFYPSIVLFLFHPLHIIDSVSLVVNGATFYFEFIARTPFFCDSTHIPIYFAMECFRIVRLLRLFCLSHKYSWMNVLYLTFKGTIVELLLLVGFLSIGVCLFGLGVFIPELDSDGPIIEPFQGFWYAIVTITTLGYGDFTPSTAGGYAVGAICCTSGVIFVSLQIPLIASIFGDLYDYAEEQILLQKQQNAQNFIEKLESKESVDQQTTNSNKTKVGFATTGNNYQQADTKSRQSRQSAMSKRSNRS